MIRILSLCAGVCGAATFSQYPEFAQQYTQRLAGQVDALSQVIADFDGSALDAGLTRTQALDQMTGTDFLNARQADMRQTFERHNSMTATLTRLRSATGLQRLQLVHRLNDPETLRNTWSDFQPAVPVTVAGAVTGGIGFVGGWGILSAVFGLLKLPFRRRKTATAAPLDNVRHDPPLQRDPVEASPRPTLMGERRP